MKLMSIKEYAISHKISIYDVVKMTKNGKLKIQTKKNEGKEEVFILVNEIEEAVKLSSSVVQEEKVGDYEKAYFKLKVQYNQLMKKLENLQKKI